VFKVMTWNVENLFKPGAPAGPQSQATYGAKIQGLASTINDQAPDVLALQEIGDDAALDDLVEHLDGTWHRRVSKHPDQRGIRVACLAQRTIAESEDIFEFPPHLQPVQVDDHGGTLAVMGRGAVAITVESESGDTVQVVTTHLKSNC
jgi:endonuclease/exonuclease/phosphatase family metal-dependent hydrolase